MARSATSSSDKAREEEAGVAGAEKAEEKQSHVNRQAKSESKRPEAEDGGEKKEKKQSMIANAWKKLDLDMGTALMMMKAAVPPTIALAMYEADSVARTYSTLGYLVAIISILGFCIMPRAKFIQTMVMNVIGVCIGAAVGLLMLWSALKAREHTTPAGGLRQRYNASHSAVCAIWLFFQIWLANTIKAKFPQFTFPTILYAIFVNVAATFGPQFQTTAQAEGFVQRLLESFLTGLALATGTSLFIMPVTCRKVVTKEITVYIAALRGALTAHKNYYQSLETKDMFRQTTTIQLDEKGKPRKPKTKPEVEAVKRLTSTFTELHGKLHGDLPFAKRELAYGKLTPEDFESIFKHLRAIMMPLVGLGSLIDLFERLAEIHHWEGEETDEENDELRPKVVGDWNELMQFVHEPFTTITQSMDQGLEHVLLRLQLTTPRKKEKGEDATDTEAKGDMVKPGDKEFADYLEKQSDDFYKGKETTLRHWMASKASSSAKTSSSIRTTSPKSSN